ncbi:hypothetical protein PPYR_01290 [Photinus pyralis]|uniref:Chitin-binding type-2 domain-containing protein n=2 Tax=Photinus pyralis TaxID=7054 RepID=A0A5N4B4N5_PHOPY|nr:uncharacterized protein LOC116158957 [Photinus pyralis]KAB0804320.1 hypothetical protein PPYR_01290 [Photinus pyralis]
MRATPILLLFVCIRSTLSFPQFNGHEKAQGTSFRPTTIAYQYDSQSSPSQAIPTRTSIYSDDLYQFRNILPVVQQRPHPRTEAPPRKPQEFRRPGPNEIEEDSKEKEIEEPDRLTILLPQSKFDCNGKNTGYYADEGLGCEVFHYCQDNAKHSWVCPEGFTFHQVHLICMPTGHDNICQQSTKYHFVNDYLYKPVNLEEHQTKPNITLRYSDRYYPDNYSYLTDYGDENEEPRPQYKQPVRPAVPVHSTPNPYRTVTVHRRPVPTQFAPTYRPESLPQVFRSPEEVNISLQQRRPPFVAQRYSNSEEDY